MALGGCSPSRADKWLPPSEVHAAIYRKDAKALKKAIAAHPESVNLESYYSVEPYGVYGYALPLSLAVRREWKEGVVILLVNGADAGKSESSGSSPMRRAIARRDAVSVRLFLEHGASPRQRVINRDGSTSNSPLDSAASTGDLELFQLLVKHGAVPDEDLSAENKIRVKELHWLDK